MTYVEGPNVWVCANLVVCNRPATANGPRTDVTDTTTFTWDATTGNLLQVVRPADAAGVHPQIDFAYSSFGPGISLPVSRTEKITSATSVVTTFDYDTANHFQMKWSIVDPGPPGLSLKTCYAFDSDGNLSAVTDPRASTCP
jgi:hypothetical protein